LASSDVLYDRGLHRDRPHPLPGDGFIVPTHLKIYVALQRSTLPTTPSLSNSRRAIARRSFRRNQGSVVRDGRLLS
jgi:hypothetical protein